MPLMGVGFAFYTIFLIVIVWAMHIQFKDHERRMEELKNSIDKLLDKNYEITQTLSKVNPLDKNKKGIL
jgi:hypothetical protein